MCFVFVSGTYGDKAEAMFGVAFEGTETFIAH